mgnify:CR=1 FL=1
MKTKIKILPDPKTEAQHQANVVNWSILHTHEHPELALLFHIPNGGTRDAIEGRHLKQQGVKRGVPDLCLPVARGGYHSLYIELKTATGRATVEQKWWGEKLNCQGNMWRVCHGWEAAVATLEWYLALPDEVSP